MSGKHKILFTLSEFMQGSKVKQVCQYARGLNKDLFEIEICAEAIGDEGVYDIKKLNLPYYKNPFFPPRSLKIAKFGRFLSSPVFLWRKKFDIVHSLHYSSLYFEPLICKFSPKTRYIYSKSNLQWDNHAFNWNLKSRLSDRIITQSESGTKLLADRGFNKKTVKIYNGVDCSEYIPPSAEDKIGARNKMGIPGGSVVFGYAAHFIRIKDHITILKSFKRLLDMNSNILLLFCGGPHDQGYHDEVVGYIKNAGLGDDVKLLGSISDMKFFYAVCDCLVFPSRFENFSLVILEAMSSGLPVIASNRGGNIEQVSQGENGFLIEPGDDAGFEKYMREYINSPGKMKIHGAASRRIVEEKYSVEVMVKKTEELYLQLLE